MNFFFFRLILVKDQKILLGTLEVLNSVKDRISKKPPSSLSPIQDQSDDTLVSEDSRISIQETSQSSFEIPVEKEQIPIYLEANLQSIQLQLVATNPFTPPLVDISIDQIRITGRFPEEIITEISFEGQYYNLFKASFEPLLEPFKFGIKVFSTQNRLNNIVYHQRGGYQAFHQIIALPRN